MPIDSRARFLKSEDINAHYNVKAANWCREEILPIVTRISRTLRPQEYEALKVELFTKLAHLYGLGKECVLAFIQVKGSEKLSVDATDFLEKLRR